MKRLNQVIAIEQSLKAKANKTKSEIYKMGQKPALFSGFTKKYRPKDDGGEKFPDEKQKVQFTARGLIEEIARTLRVLFDTEATKDFANCAARADIVVDGTTLVEKAPATFLLYLSKELTDLATFVADLPTLGEDDEWRHDNAAGLHRSEPVQTHRTKKVSKPIVLHAPTKEHPAQTQLIVEDEVVGYWDLTKLSGALTPSEKASLLAKIHKLADAVRCAREEANLVEAPEKSAGAAIMNWLFS